MSPIPTGEGIRALHAHCREDALPNVLEYLKHCQGASEEDAMALDIISEIKSRDAVQPLITLLTSHTMAQDGKPVAVPAFQDLICRALGKLGDRRAVEPIADHIRQNVNEYVIGEAGIRALGRLKAKEEISTLIAVACQSKRKEKVWEAARAIRIIGITDEIYDELADAMNSNSPHIRHNACSALRVIGTSTAKRLSQRGLFDKIFLLRRWIDQEDFHFPNHYSKTYGSDE